jgi:hypothetical protein
MITHFQWKPLIKNLPGWKVHFYFKGTRYEAIYKKNGEIEWQEPLPPSENINELQSQVHELMLFHVYE